MPQQILLGELLHDCAKRYADRPFITMAPDGETYTYKEFEKLSNRIAHGLLKQFDVLPQKTWTN